MYASGASSYGSLAPSDRDWHRRPRKVLTRFVQPAGRRRSPVHAVEKTNGTRGCRDTAYIQKYVAQKSIHPVVLIVLCRAMMCLWLRKRNARLSTEASHVGTGGTGWLAVYPPGDSPVENFEDGMTDRDEV